MGQNKEFAELFPLDFSGHSLYTPTRESIEHYYYRGWHPGGFVYHLLANDLVGSITRADHWNRSIIPSYASWMNERMPHNAWGSKEIVDNWMKDFKNES